MSTLRKSWVTSVGLGLMLALAAPATLARPRLAEGTVQEGAGVVTAGPEGAQYEFPGGTRLRAAPRTVFRVFTTPQSLTLGAGRTMDTYTVLVHSGRADFDVSRAESGVSALIVSSGKVATIATAGEHSLIADSVGVSIVNRNGEARSGPNGKYKPHDPGTVRTFSRKDPQGTPQPLLPQATFVPGKRVWVAVQGHAPIDEVAWRDVPGAQSYEVELRGRGESVPRLRRTLTSAAIRELGSLPQGGYELRVRAVDARGIESARWASTALQVVGVELPPGAYVDGEGTIRLAPEQTVRFTNADGLELSRSGNARTSPATTPIGLHQEKLTLVLLKQPEAREGTFVKLRPRGFYADVWVGSKFAVWPRDPITVRVQLKSLSEEPVPAWVQMVPRVTIGIDPVEVEWKNEGGVLTGTIQPQPQRSLPTVVRAEVADQFGLALGYDSCEVSREHARPRAGSRHNVVNASAPAR